LDRFPDDVLFWAMHIGLEDEQADRHLPFELVGPMTGTNARRTVSNRRTVMSRFDDVYRRHWPAHRQHVRTSDAPTSGGMTRH
jgi:hypothetical protein